MPDSAIGKVAASIKEFGFKSPIIVDGEGVIIAGHTRLLAAQRLELEHVPVLVADDLTPAQVKAYRLADNRTAQETSWDAELLQIELEDLAGLDIDVSLTGFDAEELSKLGSDHAPIVEDEVPEPPDEPVTKPGDLWLLGEHRVLCGDALDAAALTLLMGGGVAGCVLTDPPYGMRLDTDYSKIPGSGGNPSMVGRGRTYRPVIGDDAPFDASVLRGFFSRTKEQFWFGADYYRSTLGAEDGAGAWIVWDKRLEDGRMDDVVGSSFELLWSALHHQRRILRHFWCGAYGDPEASGRFHPTQKPSVLLADILTRWSPEGCIVADPFLGSGTTLIAAEQTGRICYGMEIDPRYCDVIVNRWQNLTGKTATLAP